MTTLLAQHDYLATAAFSTVPISRIVDIAESFRAETLPEPLARQFFTSDAPSLPYCLLLLPLYQLLDILLVVKLCDLTFALVKLDNDFLLFFVKLSCLYLELFTLCLQLANLSLLK